MGLSRFVFNRIELKKWKKFFDDNGIDYNPTDELYVFARKLEKELQRVGDVRQAELIVALKKPNIQILINSSKIVHSAFGSFVDDT